MGATGLRRGSPQSGETRTARVPEMADAREGALQREITAICMFSPLSTQHSAAAKARVQTVHSQGKNHPEASQRTALQTHTGPGRVPVSTLTGKTQDSFDWESTQKGLMLVL